jgi:hypothetical protein
MVDWLPCKKIQVDPKESEYYKAIPYGRPLFARLIAPLTDKGNQTLSGPVQATEKITDVDHGIILTRLLMNRTTDILKDDLAMLSLITTRVQLGRCIHRWTNRTSSRVPYGVLRSTDYCTALSTGRKARLLHCYHYFF